MRWKSSTLQIWVAYHSVLHRIVSRCKTWDILQKHRQLDLLNPIYEPTTTPQSTLLLGEGVTIKEKCFKKRYKNHKSNDYTSSSALDVFMSYEQQTDTEVHAQMCSELAHTKSPVNRNSKLTQQYTRAPQQACRRQTGWRSTGGETLNTCPHSSHHWMEEHPATLAHPGKSWYASAGFQTWTSRSTDVPLSTGLPLLQCLLAEVNRVFIFSISTAWCLNKRLFHS